MTHIPPIRLSRLHMLASAFTFANPSFIIPQLHQSIIHTRQTYCRKRSQTTQNRTVKIYEPSLPRMYSSHPGISFIPMKTRLNNNTSRKQSHKHR